MTRLLAATFVVALAVVAGFSQEKPPVLGRGSSNLPFEVTTVDGKPAWIVSGRGTVYVEDLLGGYANATGQRVSFTYQAAEMRRVPLGYFAPDGGMTVKHDQIAAFVSDTLAGGGLTIVGFTVGNTKVARQVEGAALSLYVEEPALARLHDAEWVTTSVSLVNVSSNIGNALAVLRGAFVTVSDYGGNVVISGTAERVRAAVRMLREFDKPPAGQPIVRSYDLPDSVKPDNARVTLTGLFPGETTEMRHTDTGAVYTTRSAPRVNVVTAPVGNRLIVRASASDHVLIAQAIAAMK